VQAIYNIAEICSQKGMREIILSPGSRCAPLTLAFTRHPDIECKTISDERSAAFIAIGMAQQTERTIGLVCTSGSAAYNYAPAVAEAFYQQIPLLILTADRPPEWIDQLDGQTIMQENIYGKHVKANYTLPMDYSHSDSIWHIERIISEAMNLTKSEPCGPVHVNIPFREPFYPTDEKPVSYNKNVKIISSTKTLKHVEENDLKDLIQTFNSYNKKLLVTGQSPFDNELKKLVKTFSASTATPLVTDVISNFQQEGSIQTQDVLLNSKNEKQASLRPDLLITFGNSIISKNLKVFIRKFKPREHWHIQAAGYSADTYQSLTRLISCQPAYLLRKLLESTPENSDPAFYNLWKEEEKKARIKLTDFFKNELQFGEFETVKRVMESLPDHSVLHLANSMSVRYANYIGIPSDKNIVVSCNRGTSGIDGVISTAYGAALRTDKIVTIITGDMAFFYDRNAFWNNYMPKNLRIVILNNHGGGIFRMIEGPAKLPELAEYFETHQPLIAENTAKDHNLAYQFCRDKKTFETYLKDFFAASSKSKILEVETDSKINTELFQKFKNSI
jgi:2-succinyl-5-enolpyruvyl-6-hydroxy-3-cyclohexene-1-carboxylate synthase